MKLVKDEKLVRLFDLYKNILSPVQQEFMIDFINNDLTITEIAENKNISRQAAFDGIKKAVEKMKNLEDTLGCLQKITALENEIENLKKRRND